MRELLITSCVCGVKHADVIGRKDDRTVGRCKSCGLVRTLERAENYEELYTEGDTYHKERDGHIPYYDRYDHDYGIAATRWPKLVRHQRLLDVGCANGAFVKYAAQMGFDAYGLELNPHMAAWAREKTKRPIFEAWGDVPGQYHIITLHDVFEHVVDPHEELNRLRGHLYVGGLLIIDTPDADDPRFAKLGMQWHHMKPREHLWFWTKPLLQDVLEDHEFRVLEIDQPIQGKLVAYACRSY